MPYCPRCGVEADPSVRRCALCSTPIPVLPDLGAGEPAWPAPFDRDPALDPSKTYAPAGQRRRRAFAAVTAVVATAAGVVSAVDLFTTGGLSWSRYPLVSLAATLALVGAGLLWHGRPRAWGAAWGLVTAVFLTVLDLVRGEGLTWSVVLGVPVTALTFGLIFTGAALARRSARRGYDLFGLIPALVTVELAGIDALVNLWTTGLPGLGWSLVAALALVPLALLFFVLHSLFHRTPDLRRTFHF